MPKTLFTYIITALQIECGKIERDPTAFRRFHLPDAPLVWWIATRKARTGDGAIVLGLDHASTAGVTETPLVVGVELVARVALAPIRVCGVDATVFTFGIVVSGGTLLLT